MQNTVNNSPDNTGNSGDTISVDHQVDDLCHKLTKKAGLPSVDKLHEVDLTV